MSNRAENSKKSDAAAKTQINKKRRLPSAPAKGPMPPDRGAERSFRDPGILNYFAQRGRDRKIAVLIDDLSCRVWQASITCQLPNLEGLERRLALRPLSILCAL